MKNSQCIWNLNSLDCSKSKDQYDRLSNCREIHYHVKVEIEKKAFERLPDFNTVASFTIIDDMRYGYLDFENLKRFF